MTHRESFTPGERDRPWHPSNTKLLGPQDRTGGFGEDRYVPGIEHNSVRCNISIIYKLNVKTANSKTELLYVLTSQVAQLVERLRYKPEDHGFDCRWCH